MAEAIVSKILEHLASLAIEKASEAWRLVTGVEKKVKRLQSNFEVLRCELADAEEKQFADQRVKLWLDRFKEVAYDMEDVLEDWKIALQQLQTTEGGVETSSASVSKWKVTSCLSCFSFGSHVVKRYDIATRIEEINEQVDQIVKERVNFELIKREIKQPVKRQESTAFVDVSELHGRNSAKEDIISKLFSGGGSSQEGTGNNIPTIALLGMGGIGKTALAQLVYNDSRIQIHFEYKIWVCVSDPFDQIQIAQAILGVIDPDSTHTHSNQKLQTLLYNISTKIAGKKFFLVLDDVWTNDAQDWKPFKVAFQSALFGSKILITTRKESVADQMVELSRIFHLDLLSQEACWLILKQVAFSERKKKEAENVEDIGWEIAEKCKGLPLVAKTLGGLLRDKLRRREWQNVLNSEIWKLDLAKKDVFAPLLLSYYDLPSPERGCLLYCAIFPKDYRMRKDELIQHWMAQGYLSSGENSQMEKGEDYYNCLAAHSFFQDFEYSGVEGPSFKMHDVVHDFLLFLTQCEFIEKTVKCIEDYVAQDSRLVIAKVSHFPISVGGTERLRSPVTLNSSEVDKCIEDYMTMDLSSKRPRHLRLVIANWGYFPISVGGTERLRSLVILNNPMSVIKGEAIGNLLSVAKRLRLVEFGSSSWSSSVYKIPDIIGKSIHLRYLGLRRTQIKNLPETVCELHNLETLDLRYCSDLEKLPNGIGKLINLRHLYTDYCWRLAYYPKGIGRLTSLVVLSAIIARVDRNDIEEFSFGDFENLNLLREHLFVKLVGDNVIDWKELERAKLDKKEQLKVMYIANKYDDEVQDKIFKALNKPSNLLVRFDETRLGRRIAEILTERQRSNL